MLRQLLQSVHRAWDRLRHGPEVRRLIRRVRKLEASSKESESKWETHQGALKRASASRHRRVLSPDIVRGLLPLRAGTIQARAADASAASADGRLIDVSPGYAKALAASRAPADELVRTDLQGLAWWVPIPASLTGAARERFLAKQRFPYRNITQTREFAQGPVMLDIGANTGRMSIPRVILGDFVRAYGAEPDPLNFSALVRNVADNGLRGLVLPDQVAIGAVTGPARLRHAKYSGGHRLVTGTEADGTIEVPCWRLDDWCERLSIDPALVTYVKVDTQGWEVNVLRGAPRLLSCSHIAWQLEISPGMLRAAGALPEELFDICAGRFSHFVDLGKKAAGPRARRTTELASALGHLDGDSQTDVILFNAR